MDCLEPKTLKISMSLVWPLSCHCRGRPEPPGSGGSPRFAGLRHLGM